jgi:phosphate acetyltransferase
MSVQIYDYFLNYNVNMNYEDAYSYSRSEFTEHQNQGKINEVYDTIIEKYKNLENEFDFVLVEGSDFTEEGSVFEIDFNGSIAKEFRNPSFISGKRQFRNRS